MATTLTKLFSKKKLPSGKIYNQLINNYNVGILTTVIRKKFYEKLEKKFDNRYSIIGDFDLFLRLSKICCFESVQQPLAFYRIHGKNFSINFKENEIEETKMWLNENKLQLTETQFKKIEKENFFREFINCKLYGNYKDTIIFLLNHKKNLFNLKNFVILFIPNIMLKKLLWFH